MEAPDGGTLWMWHAGEIRVNIGARMEIKPRREDDGGHVRLGRPVMRVGKWRTSAAGTGGALGVPGATRRRDTEPGNVVDVTLGRNPCKYRREDRDQISARGLGRRRAIRSAHLMACAMDVVAKDRAAPM